MAWVREEIEDGIVEYKEVLYFDDSKKHHLSVGESRYIKGTYYIWYVLGDAMRIKGPFDASSMEDAKEKALARVKSYIDQHAQYWLNIQSQIDSAL